MAFWTYAEKRSKIPAFHGLPMNALVQDQAPSRFRNEKALEHCCSRACRLVRLAGIEPTTPWFVAKYSIQLSYSR